MVSWSLCRPRPAEAFDRHVPALELGCLGAAIATAATLALGSEYVYNDAGYELLAAVVEVVAGEGFEDFVTRELFRPAGLGSTGFLGGEEIDGAYTARGYESRTAFGRPRRVGTRGACAEPAAR